jgi:hypothetical protein
MMVQGELLEELSVEKGAVEQPLIPTEKNVKKY